MTRKRVIILIVIAVVVAAGIAAIYGIRSRNAARGTEVRTETVASKDLVSLVTANGTIAARTKVDVSANIMGQITELYVEEGQAVRAGQLMLIIDQARYDAVVAGRAATAESLESELTRVREASAQADRDLQRAERQFKDDILPAAELDRLRSISTQAAAAVRTVEKQIAQARADLRAARDELTKTEIRAPMDGVVTRRNVEKGEVVVTGTMNNPGTVLMTISDMAVIEAVLEVDQTDVPSLAIGQPASVLIDAFPDQPFPGHVTEIGSSPLTGASALGGAATGTDYEVKVTLDRHPPSVRPGLTVTADVTTATRSKVLTVPIGALVLREENSGGAAVKEDKPEDERKSTSVETIASVASRRRDVEGVYAVRDGKVEFLAVTTGIKGELDIEILSGLQAGDVVVVGPFKALRELKPGDAVTLEARPGEKAA